MIFGFKSLLNSLRKNKDSNNSIKICFVALGNVYSLINGIKPKKIVGTDVQQFLLSNEFKTRYKTSIITFSDSSSSVENIDGLEVLTIKRNHYNCNRLNFFYTIFKIWMNMLYSKADIFFYTGLKPGIIVPFSWIIGKKSVYIISSDALTNPKLITQKLLEFNSSPKSIGSIGNWLDIKLASSVISQNRYQYQMLRTNYNRNSELIQMTLPNLKKGTIAKDFPPSILWVGSITEVKQPQIFLELAKRISKTNFIMIGGYDEENTKLFSNIVEMGKKISNFQYLGVVPFEKVDDYFSQCSIFVNTSLFEGFPNSFIQSMRNGVPIVSLNVNPDFILTKYSLGFVSNSIDKMEHNINKLLQDENLLITMGENCIQFANQFFEWDMCIQKYEIIIRNFFKKTTKKISKY